MILDMMEQQRDMLHEMLDQQQDTVNKTIQNTNKWALLEQAGYRIRKEAESSFKSAIDDVLRIQNLTHAEAELRMGATPESIPEFTSPHELVQQHWDERNARRGGDAADSMDPLEAPARVADELERIDTLVSSSGSTDSLTESDREFLIAEGIDPDDPASIHRAAVKARRMADAFESLRGPEPDIPAFLDRLGEVADEFRADAVELGEAATHLTKMKYLLHIFNEAGDPRDLIERGIDLVVPGISRAWAALEAYFEEFISGGAELFDYLVDTVGMNSSDDRNQIGGKIMVAVRAAQRRYDDAMEGIGERSTHMVRPEDADPTDGNQWSELMRSSLLTRFGTIENQIEGIQAIRDKLSRGEELSEEDLAVLHDLNIDGDSPEDQILTLNNVIVHLQEDLDDEDALMSETATSLFSSEDEDLDAIEI